MGGLVRAGGVMLAVATIASGGLAIGAGTAAAQGSSAGSSDYYSYSSDPGPCGWPPGFCDDERFQATVQVGDTYLDYRGPDRAAPGTETTFIADFYAGDPTASMPPLEPVEISSVTNHTPKGFEFVGATVTRHTYNGALETLDSTTSVDPRTGDVTVKAANGAWAVPKGNNSRVKVVLTYRVNEVGFDTTSGITFTGTDTPTSGKWVAVGNTQKYNDYETVFGSAEEALPNSDEVLEVLSVPLILMLSLPGSSDGIGS
ncbi:conserved exported hypothetical protein [Rhodococcus sp. RD6.2]|uniref:hypothetical protein n=1 Tax=Rhodococcus sp. RD6.2 TaxID=260936 RepID=UPI00063B9107|nr:hypothetical protein [Rhodococcus sp. RD6.2]CRK53942.1 conserved exported hypothetical protein [Rhodococcus sp. RD6.2]